jgi:hypothetical protein
LLRAQVLVGLQRRQHEVTLRHLRLVDRAQDLVVRGGTA